MEVLRIISQLSHVAGRFEYVKSSKGITAIIDYAHTPDALENVLATIGAFRKGTTKVLTVVGCGGDRDKEKRPKMAAIAASKSNQLILTSDNPRFENPDDILDQMEVGVPATERIKVHRISDRREAIFYAVRTLAQAGDIVLVAGKGHETYQDIHGVKSDFDDKAVISEAYSA
jgi:UDP-N-acetylmuramoyl-L-alanyl-D-glutamate--2,6-diaminopimelate ligase